MRLQKAFASECATAQTLAGGADRASDTFSLQFDRRKEVDVAQAKDQLVTIQQSELTALGKVGLEDSRPHLSST